MNKKLYCDNWQQLRNQILDRDGRKCVRCGKADRSYYIKIKPNVWQDVTVEEYKKLENELVVVRRLFLQVSHKDNDKTNNDPSNLQSLCPLCHLQYDDQWKRLKRLSDRRL